MKNGAEQVFGIWVSIISYYILNYFIIVPLWLVGVGYTLHTIIIVIIENKYNEKRNLDELKKTHPDIGANI